MESALPKGDFMKIRNAWMTLLMLVVLTLASSGAEPLDAVFHPDRAVPIAEYAWVRDFFVFAEVASCPMA